MLCGPLLQQVGIGLLGYARHPRGGDLPWAAQHDLRFAHIVRVEIGRGKDIARIREVGQRGQFGADRSADGALEHAADQQGISCSAQSAWMSRDAVRPPTRTILILTTLQSPSGPAKRSSPASA